LSVTHERIVQAEEGIAQVQKVLDHAQGALAVAEQVEVAATRSRKLLKVLAILAVVGIVVLIIMKVAGGSDTGPELTVVEDPAPGNGDSGGDDTGGPAA
jgi:hypothetical protein